MDSLNNNKVLRATIICQNRLRLHFENLKIYNNDIDIIRERIMDIINRIQNNYDIGLINQEKYNNTLEKVDIILIEFNSLPSNIQLRDISKFDLVDLRIKLYSIKETVVKLVCECGTSKLLTVVEILVKDNFNIFDTSTFKYLKFLDNVFIPIGSKIVIPTKESDTDKINIKNIDIINASLIEKIDGAIIEIPCDNNILIINGYFIKDPLNIYKNDIYLKKKIEHINDNIKSLDISSVFVKSYINQMNTRDIVVLSVDKIIRKIKKDYDYLNNLKCQLLSSLVKEFLMSNLQDQRKILTLFLIFDSNETKHLAYLLYDMITTSSDSIKPQFMADAIFKSLHWSVQKKFKIAHKNVEDYRKQLLTLNEDNISYEDRIIQMKVPDNVKSKALDKLKEVNINKDSVKAQNYLDGLLKIPFGNYKKEKILSFLEEFSKNIKNLVNECTESIKNINDIDETIVLIKIKLTEIFDYYNNDNFETENKLDELLSKIENKLKDINNFIAKDSNYASLDNDIYPLMKSESSTSLNKLDKIKLLNDKINNCDDDNNNEDFLNKIEVEISDNIKKELENLKDNITGYPESPKLTKSRKFDISNEYECEHEKDEKDEDKCNNLKLLEEYRKWKTIESQLMNLLNEWTRYKHSKKEYMATVRKTLDTCVHGQHDAKKHIERIIAQWINGKMEGNVFGFQGPPGVGKTTLCKKGLSKCLLDDNGESRPFSFIALGGASHGSYLDGHNYTYLGSTWGRIVDIIIETKCMNPIIYIDELDKISKTENGKEIIGILTHLTDPSQNDEFTDKFFSGIKLDLSKALIVFSYNDSSLIDPILKDRVTEVKVKSITKKEKNFITKEYLLPEILKIVGYEKNDFIFNDDVINYIIDTYTYEAGVRKLKERLFDIVREINLLKVLGEEDLNLPFEVTEEFVIKQFSDRTKVQFTKIAKNPQIGLVNGLYATSAGIGGITIIEVMKTPTDTKLSLELTGNQGDVMKESMRCAKTVAWNLLPHEIKKNIKTEWDDIGTFGLHIHCPDAAMPKDGPSAGIAITSAILSRLCNIKIRNTIAMTGEIDLNGKVHPIGGLESKLDGAKKAGVTKVLIPEDNKHDYERIINSFTEDEEKQKFFDNFEIKLVGHFKEVVNEVLVENDLHFNFDE